ncbi:MULTISPECIES: MFS transporter [Pseudomonas]|jgi:MFS family permease|uniref:MFS transporter n=1 Tax=Pseudomonas TaxID=286 RepID=UPI0009536BF4|nr:MULTISPECIES: MFS transporter [Pseudomonas]WLG65417.1 MFS transporter [Pseudomonas brassicacearum]SIS02471.1 Major Facilitator Superfamily protein [Pseudomonas sp. A214]
MKYSIETAASVPEKTIDKATVKVITAASIGTVFEWYEFTLYGALAAALAVNFFSGLDSSTGFIFALLTFAVGFIMRPVGAIIFGRIGDRIGRKKTFLITIVIMGVATVGVGVLPTYDSVGIIAPILLITMRMLQGLALGGEYGGAATYVSEHSKPHNRGFNTAWISGTGTVGLLLAFAVVLASRAISGDEFNDWGWRIPFLASVLLLGISVVIRMGMEESPAFKKMKEENRLSKAPLTETFLDKANAKRLVIALFGICGGMTCAYYMAVLYPTFFMTQSLKIDPQQANTTLTLALLAGLPMFLFAGWLCDRFGRKPVLLAGFLLSAIFMVPIYKGIAHYGNPDLVAAQARVPVTLITDGRECSFLFNPTGTRVFKSPCDVAKQALTAAGVSYETTTTSEGGTRITIGSSEINVADLSSVGDADVKAKSAELKTQVVNQLVAEGFPATAKKENFQQGKVLLILIGLVFCGVITLTPVAPMLVEMFPTRIRYTSMSFPYHFASGWIGGLLPTVAFAMSAQAGNIYQGLWYPLFWISLSLVVGLFFLRETRDVDINL